MEDIFVKLSKVLVPSIRVVEYTELTQYEIGKDNVLLWNRLPLSIENTIYIELKEVLKKRPAKYYNHSSILPYHEFCIAMLCSLNYSLNHKITTDVTERTFTAAWRAIVVIANTGSKKISDWIKQYIQDRTPIGYCNELGISLDNATSLVCTNISNNTILNEDDCNIVNSICMYDEVTTISHYRDDENYNVSDNNLRRVHSTNSTTEGSLFDIELCHAEFNI